MTINLEIIDRIGLHDSLSNEGYRREFSPYLDNGYFALNLIDNDDIPSFFLFHIDKQKGKAEQKDYFKPGLVRLYLDQGYFLVTYLKEFSLCKYDLSIGKIQECYKQYILDKDNESIFLPSCCLVDPNTVAMAFDNDKKIRLFNLDRKEGKLAQCKEISFDYHRQPPSLFSPFDDYLIAGKGDLTLFHYDRIQDKISDCGKFITKSCNGQPSICKLGSGFVVGTDDDNLNYNFYFISIDKITHLFKRDDFIEIKNPHAFGEFPPDIKPLKKNVLAIRINENYTKFFTEDETNCKLKEVEEIDGIVLELFENDYFLHVSKGVLSLKKLLSKEKIEFANIKIQKISTCNLKDNFISVITDRHNHLAILKMKG